MKGVQGLIEMMQGTPKPPAVQRGIDALGETEHWARIEEKLNQMDPVAYKALAGELSGAPAVTDQLGSIRLRTTVIAGEADEPFIEPSKAMAAAISDAELRVIPDAAHSPQYENAPLWREAIDGHLQWVG